MRPLFTWIPEGTLLSQSWIGYRWKHGSYYELFLTWRWHNVWHLLYAEYVVWGKRHAFFHDTWTDEINERAKNHAPDIIVTSDGVRGTIITDEGVYLLGKEA